MKIAILSREDNYTNRRLVEEAEKAGHEIRVIDFTRCYVQLEQSKPQVFFEGESLNDIDAIIPRIGASVTSYGAAIIRQFEMMGVYSSVSSLALVRSRDKLRSYQLLSRAKVGIPKSVFARRTQDAASIVEMLGGAPLIVKLLEGKMGKGVVLAETRKAAKSVIEAFYSISAEFLVQEFIEEAHGADVRALIVGGEIVGAMMRQGEEGEFRSNLHRGGKALPVELSKKEHNLALKAASTMGLQIAGVDIIRSKRGPLILEINSSPGLEGIEKATKLDIAGSVIDFVVTRAQGKRRRDKIGA